MSGVLSHVPTGGSPSVPSPYATLIAKLEELDAYSHTVLHQYPRVERHLLCADIRQCLTAINRATIVAWKRYHKKTALQELDIEIEVLRHGLRKSLRLQYITPRRYEIWARHVNEVGRMVGGWIKSMQA